LDDSAPLFNPSLGTSAYRQAWEYMMEVALDLEAKIGLPIEQWAELSMARVGLHLVEGVEVVNPTSQKLFYRITDSAAHLLVTQAADSIDAFDAARMVATANIWNSEAMPASLRAFSVGVMNGTFLRPSHQGGGVTNLFLRWQIYSGCHSVHDLFGLSLVRQDHDTPESASDLLANLATEFGHPYSFNTIRDWHKKKSYAKFRNRCDAASAYMRDKYLFDLGVIKILR